VIELEPVVAESGPTPPVHAVVQEIMAELLRTPDLSALCAVAARRVRQLTGHDRAWVYRFHEDNHGEIIAEDLTADLPPYLGLHYPAGDIPLPARQLFLKSWVRLIQDAPAANADLLRVAGEDETPLDMSYCALRAVSPMHVEYLHNMGIRATMSISLIHEGRLWGLISCQSQLPRAIPLDARASCELIAQMMSLQLGAAEARQEAEYKLRLQAGIGALVAELSGVADLPVALLRCASVLSSWLACGGVAVVAAADMALVGQTPPAADVRALVNWLATHSTEAPYATDGLAAAYPPATTIVEVASGLLALPVLPLLSLWVLWFRPEVARTVRWRGEPTKEIQQTPVGARLSPRKSFDTWKETVRQRALPWSPHELSAVRDLGNAFLNVVVRRIATLAQLNEELQRSNEELDSFAYIASHDLKEPLRGIHFYAQFVQEDYGDRLDEEGRERLRTVVRLTQRMDDLIDALLNYSRVGRADLEKRPTDLDSVVDGVLEFMAPRLAQAGMAVRRPVPLPIVRCDGVRVAEIFSNLIANAMKYNSQKDKWLEIGCEERPPATAGTSDGRSEQVFFVRDNGIGIPVADREAIFRLFRRLHGRDEYGGGTGIGLTIVRKVVERHGGRIWVESVAGEGSTFYFTLESRDGNGRGVESGADSDGGG